MVSVGGLIGLVAAAQILHVVGAFGYRLYNERNPEKAIRCYHCKATNKIPMLRWLLVGLVFLSWVFSISTTAACTFLTMEQFLMVQNRYTGTRIKTHETYLGLRGIGDAEQECQRGSLEDDRFEAAYSFGVLNCLLTSMGFLLLVLVQFNAFQKTTHLQDSIWNALQWILYSSFWCCALTFYAQESSICDITEETLFVNHPGVSSLLSIDDLQFSGYDWKLTTNCSLGAAGIAQVFNAVLLVMICVLSVVTIPPAIDNDSSNHPGKVVPMDTTATHNKKAQSKNAGTTPATAPKAKHSKRHQEPEEAIQEESDEEELY